jgi:hypothetical protein
MPEAAAQRITGVAPGRARLPDGAGGCVAVPGEEHRYQRGNIFGGGASAHHVRERLPGGAIGVS